MADLTYIKCARKIKTVTVRACVLAVSLEVPLCHL